jgi:hypothetical protein
MESRYERQSAECHKDVEIAKSTRLGLNVRLVTLIMVGH